MIKKLFIFLLICSSTLFAESKFILLLGPSGVGKSTIIHHLRSMDKRFTYITPYTTRKLRPGEEDKIHVDRETIECLNQEGKLLTVNEIYGIYYATPKELIDSSLEKGNFPILDWPVDKMEVMIKNYKKQLFTIYLAPDNLTVLKERLNKDSRDQDGKRFAAGQVELLKYHQGVYDSVINLKLINKTGKEKELAAYIYKLLQ